MAQRFVRGLLRETEILSSSEMWTKISAGPGRDLFPSKTFLKSTILKDMLKKEQIVRHVDTAVQEHGAKSRGQQKFLWRLSPRYATET